MQLAMLVCCSACRKRVYVFVWTVCADEVQESAPGLGHTYAQLAIKCHNWATELPGRLQ
jgi:hypothetical protein